MRAMVMLAKRDHTIIKADLVVEIPTPVFLDLTIVMKRCMGIPADLASNLFDRQRDIATRQIRGIRNQTEYRRRRVQTRKMMTRRMIENRTGSILTTTTDG